MTRYLIVDTETNKLFQRGPKDAPPIAADADGQPRMAGITMIPVGEDLQPDGDTVSTLVRPNGWEIEPDAGAVNGLTTERCELEGVDIEGPLLAFTRFIREEKRVVVAFNSQFDTKQIRGELRRAGMDDLFLETLTICIMKAGMKLRVQKAGDKKGGFPKLADVHRHFYGVDPDGQHTSLGDANSCLMIFRKMIEAGSAPEPSILFAKSHA